MVHDPAYVRARTALLDALEALSPQLAGIVLVGAQAVYLRTGSGIAAVAPYTTDADLAVDPRKLREDPPIPRLLAAGNIELDDRADRRQPGMWVRRLEVEGRQTPVPVELLVPDGVSPPGGTRGARLGVHGSRTARKTKGLEACLVDKEPLVIGGLEPEEPRRFEVQVAGEAGLLIAKAHKLRDRLDAGREHRLSDKDAVDVYRLLLATPAEVLSERYERVLASEVSRAIAEEALIIMEDLFAARARPGVAMATRALAGYVPEERVAVVCRQAVEGLRGLRR